MSDIKSHSKKRKRTNMRIIIDTRETDLYGECYSICNIEGNVLPIVLESEMLPLGDIVLKSDDDHSVLIVERKSIPDLLASIKDGRYTEQSYRLQHSDEFPLHNVIYLIEGKLADYTPNEKRTVISTLTSLQYFKGFSVMRTQSVKESAEWIVWMADKIDREFVKGHLPSVYKWRGVKEEDNEKPTEGGYCSVVKKIKKDNITHKNVGSILLSQIPGISSKFATAIMAHSDINGQLPLFFEILKTNPDILESIVVGNKGRKLGKKIVVKLQTLLLSPTT